MASQPMPEPAARPLRPPLTLTSLPAEILSMIGRLIDKPTSLSLARVSPKFTLAVESGIWESLDLFLPPYYTDPPRVAAYFRRNGNDNRYDPVFSENYRLGDEAHRLSINQHILGIMRRADDRHWRMVERLRLVPREGTLDHVLQLLGRVASTLEGLEIESPSYHDYRCWGSEALEPAMLKAELKFPSLTHIKLGFEVVSLSYIIPLLCNASPALISLDLSMNHYISEGPYDPNPLEFERDTGIRQLRIVFNDSNQHSAEEGPEPIVLELLRRIPLIEQMSINCYTWTEPDLAFGHLVSAFEGFKNLRDLRWRTDCSGGFGEGVNLDDDEDFVRGEMGIRRLVLSKCSMWTDIFYNLPHLPDLEALYMDTGTDRTFWLPVSCWPRGSDAEVLGPDFDAQLRRCPQLSVIQDISSLAIPYTPYLAEHLDKIDQAASRRGHVWSVLHEGCEMLHVGIWTSHKPSYSDELEWRWVEHYGSFKGYHYPLKIIQEMKEMEGGGAEYWERRGAVIGKKAWKVLLDWDEMMEWSCVNAHTGEWEGPDRG